MRFLKEGLPNLASRLTHDLMTGSVSAVAILVLGAFGLFWLGLALHWALLPAVGMFWAWFLPSLLYLAVAGAVAMAVFRTGNAQQKERSSQGQAGQSSPEPMNAERLGMELGMELSRELEREVRDHPLRAVSIALLGGAVLGASPELRRTLFGRGESRAGRRDSGF